jgi:hypothetical protein
VASQRENASLTIRAACIQNADVVIYIKQMGIAMGMFKAPKGPSQQELQAQQEAAARAERDNIALEQSGSQAAQQKLMAAATAKQDLRQQAVGVIDEEVGRKKFLKGL